MIIDGRGVGGELLSIKQCLSFETIDLYWPSVQMSYVQMILGSRQWVLTDNSWRAIMHSLSLS